MNHFIKRSLVFLFVFQSLCHAFANDNTVKYNKDILQLMHDLPPSYQNTIGDRINWFSQQFLKRPYLLSALGEGPDGEFDQFPLYRTDGFDCETLVDTVLALANAQDFQYFEKHILEIRYQDGKAHFITRNHFTNPDWNTSNQHKHYIEDITPRITFKNHPIFLKTTTFINKKNWYQKLPIGIIRIANSTKQEQVQKLKELQDKARKVIKNTHSIITYLPIHELFDEHLKARQEIFQQIPQGTIIEIVRPQWDLQDKIGTQLDVSHLGFAIWKQDILYFRNASSFYHQVSDEPLENYLKNTLHNPTIKGIHLEKPLEKR